MNALSTDSDGESDNCEELLLSSLLLGTLLLDPLELLDPCEDCLLESFSGFPHLRTAARIAVCSPSGLGSFGGLLH